MKTRSALSKVNHYPGNNNLDDVLISAWNSYTTRIETHWASEAHENKENRLLPSRQLAEIHDGEAVDCHGANA